jgi:hypothetical protein
VVIFISKPTVAGIVYVCRRSLKSQRYMLWSIGRAEIPSGPDIRIDASTVPHHIRRQAYRVLAVTMKGGMT